MTFGFSSLSTMGGSLEMVQRIPSNELTVLGARFPLRVACESSIQTRGSAAEVFSTSAPRRSMEAKAVISSSLLRL